MKVLVTGAAGFIGFHVVKRLLHQGMEVVGVDNLNDYYGTKIKYDRLKLLEGEKRFTFHRRDISKRGLLLDIFRNETFDAVVNLAAYAGVRHSIKYPQKYIDSNITGFLNVVESCVSYKVKHLVYASSSSVYGDGSIPFSVHDRTDNPLSLYAVTKKTNELMAAAYHSLYDLPSTGLRFFTVYGEWGRPDMALYKFAKNIMRDLPIEVYDKGHMIRSFTYITDAVTVVLRVLKNTPEGHKVYNVANPLAVPLERYIEVIEENLGKIAKKKYVGHQLGDIRFASANIDETVEDFGFKPWTTLEKGVGNFIEWFKEYEGRNYGSSKEDIQG